MARAGAPPKKYVRPPTRRLAMGATHSASRKQPLSASSVPYASASSVPSGAVRSFLISSSSGNSNDRYDSDLRVTASDPEVATWLGPDVFAPVQTDPRCAALSTALRYRDSFAGDRGGIWEIDDERKSMHDFAAATKLGGMQCFFDDNVPQSTSHDFFRQWPLLFGLATRSARLEDLMRAPQNDVRAGGYQAVPFDMYKELSDLVVYAGGWCGQETDLYRTYLGEDRKRAMQRIANGDFDALALSAVSSQDLALAAGMASTLPPTRSLTDEAVRRALKGILGVGASRPPQPVTRAISVRPSSAIGEALRDPSQWVGKCALARKAPPARQVRAYFRRTDSTDRSAAFNAAPDIDANARNARNVNANAARGFPYWTTYPYAIPRVPETNATKNKNNATRNNTTKNNTTKNNTTKNNATRNTKNKNNATRNTTKNKNNATNNTDVEVWLAPYVARGVALGFPGAGVLMFCLNARGRSKERIAYTILRSLDLSRALENSIVVRALTASYCDEDCG